MQVTPSLQPERVREIAASAPAGAAVAAPS
jgi:hypothetical protein